MFRRLVIAALTVSLGITIPALAKSGNHDHPWVPPAPDHWAGHSGDTTNVQGCDPLDGAQCLLPYPNDWFTKDDPTSATGRRLDLTMPMMPRNAAGKPMLLVNTASHCGFTPQFKGLEAAYEKYKDRGLVVVGFSSDDFNQEAKDEDEAATVCFINYGVTFTMLAPQHVKGPDANTVFKELAKQTQEPKWNFNKYLVAADGKVVQYFDSRVAPESDQFNAAVEKLLK